VPKTVWVEVTQCVQWDIGNIIDVSQLDLPGFGAGEGFEPETQERILKTTISNRF